MALIERAGARTVGVCQAEPERSRKIAERREYEFPMLSDPTRIGYAAFGLLDGEVASVLNDDAWEPGDLDTAQKLAASRHGTERALVDHAWQLPGEFIIARGGRIMLTHRAQFCGDFPPTAILLGAVAQAGD
jgi:peroxiredoxin